MRIKIYVKEALINSCGEIFRGRVLAAGKRPPSVQGRIHSGSPAENLPARINQSFLKAILLVAALTACSTTHALAAAAGDVLFYPVADTSFDPYTIVPNATEQQWMRDHYARMQAWSPYFDARLSWFPDAWFYRNAYGLFPSEAIVSQHPDWLLRDSTGAPLYIPFNCSGGTCPLLAADFGNQAFRDWWIAQAQATMQKGYRGIWIDDVNMTWRVSDGNENHVAPIDPRTGSVMTLQNWRRYLAEFMEQIRAALPNAEIAHNAIWYATDSSFSDPYLVRQVRAATYINLERGAADTGLVFGTDTFGFETFLSYIDFVHNQGTQVALLDETTTMTAREFALAGWFLISAGNDLAGTENQNWYAPDRWWQGYDLRLGQALGNRYQWNGLLRRDFSCGSVFLNQPEAPGVNLALPGTFYSLTGATQTHLSLGPREARILLRGCRQPAAPTGLTIN